MLQGWTIFVSVLGSLLAVLAGSGLAMIAQKREWERQQAVRWDNSRREVYSKFLGACSAYFLALCDVARPMRKLEDIAKVHTKYEVAESMRSEVTSCRAEVDMLAQRQTRLAARALFDYLKETNTRLDTAHGEYAKNKVRPAEVKEYLEYEKEYSDKEHLFLRAVSSELHIEELPPEPTKPM
jgi:hypothetical protein